MTRAADRAVRRAALYHGRRPGLTGMRHVRAACDWLWAEDADADPAISGPVTVEVAKYLEERAGWLNARKRASA